MTASRARSTRTARVLFVGAVVANLVLLYLPKPDGGGGPPHVDKVVHLLAFAAVAWSGLRARVPASWLLPVLALHAGVSEILQDRLIPGRSGDGADVVADLLGIFTGAALARASRSGPTGSVAELK